MSDYYTAEYLTKFRTAEVNARADHRRLARDFRLARDEQREPEKAPSWRTSRRLHLPGIHLPHLHVGH